MDNDTISDDTQEIIRNYRTNFTFTYQVYYSIHKFKPTPLIVCNRIMKLVMPTLSLMYVCYQLPSSLYLFDLFFLSFALGSSRFNKAHYGQRTLHHGFVWLDVYLPGHHEPDPVVAAR